MANSQNPNSGNTPNLNSDSLNPDASNAKLSKPSFSDKGKNQKENPFLSLLINVVVPYLILTKSAQHLGEKGPTLSLILALCLPVTYGLFDFLKNERTNYISIFGIFNTLFTGGFALLALSSLWFIAKEAAFPLLIGLFVLYSSFGKKPVVKYIFNFSQIMDLEKIQSKLLEYNNVSAYEKLIIKINNWLALSFFLSAVLNLGVALWVFKDINQQLPEIERTHLLNQQIADMWWLGYVVIALPLTGFLMFILLRLVNGLKELTHLELDEIIIQK
jgi:hypothetical protein